MNSIAEHTTEWKTEYQQRAEATRSRRAAKNLYKRPTKLQKQAWQKAMQSRRLYGDPVFTRQELEALSTHPFLLESQRKQYVDMLVAEDERAIASYVENSTEAQAQQAIDSLDRIIAICERLDSQAKAASAEVEAYLAS